MSKISIPDFVTEFNYMVQGGENMDPDVIQELMSLVADMFKENCGEVPNFELTEKGQIVLLSEDESSEEKS